MQMSCVHCSLNEDTIANLQLAIYYSRLTIMIPANIFIASRLRRKSREEIREHQNIKQKIGKQSFHLQILEHLWVYCLHHHKILMSIFVSTILQLLK